MMLDALEMQPDAAVIADGAVVVGTVDTRMGMFGAVFTAQGLACLSFPGDPVDGCDAWVRRRMPSARTVREDGALDSLATQLTGYFDGTRREFEVPLDLRGTAFQVEVWQALLAVPYGEVRSYAAVAQAIGRPKAVRAVGMANHDNPIPIIVPCHRVIGSNGTLTGYGGGIERKERLLRLEGVLLA